MVTKRIEPVLQWTKELALNWSAQNYREQYLGIGQFGYIPIIQETEFCTYPRRRGRKRGC